MSLMPALVSFIAGTFGWAGGKALGGVWLGAVMSMTAGGLGFYYTRKYVKELKDMMGG